MKHCAMIAKKCLLILSLFLFFPLFAQEKIDHQYDVWYQLVCIPTDSDSEPYTAGQNISFGFVPIYGSP